ncbi:MAG: DUF2933 domain-containing protein [Alicyclobacillus sp.]|uniref:DUF2933 domain-containing protein n=1 Tax=Alicyclobacillus suci TaxID=2816080 RepID=UPI001A906FC1|nr:DUF2933 domain-containing protein [Alicyclobacillus suci]MCL6442130.1 DUF2933 domain-containing protein [Alicyclobacillus sp.]
MLQTIGTIVAFLACPLMMVLMMKGMHGGHDGHSMHGDAKRKFHSKEEELADLREKLQDMQAQYDRIARDMQNESTSHKPSDRYREIHL